VAVLALPSIFGPYPDGRVRRLAIIGFGCADAPSAELFEVIVARLHDRELVDGALGTRAVLRREANPEWLTARVIEWESVTPVILERPAFLRKDWERLGHADRSRDARAGDPRAASELAQLLASRREDLLREAVRRLGLGEPLHVDFSSAPWRLGLHPARQYRTAGYLRASPRFHVRMRFRDPVPGPIVVGRGRYVGFGLLRPLEMAQA
jgi:CRISPR-associated protein Csb2